MNEFIIKALDSGFTFFFAVMMVMFVWILIKQSPKLIKVWTDFNLAITDNSIATRELSKVVESNNTSVLAELREFKKRLENHCISIDELNSNQEEILELLNEIKAQIEKEK